MLSMFHVGGYYSATKKTKSRHLRLHGWGFEGVMLSEMSQKEKDKNHTIPLIGGIKQMNKKERNKKTPNKFIDMTTNWRFPRWRTSGGR